MKSRIPSHIAALVLGGIAGLAVVSYFNANQSPKRSTQEVEQDQPQLAVSAPSAQAEKDSAPAIDEPNRIETFHDRVALALSYESERRKRWEIERLFEDMTPAEAPTLFAMIWAKPEYQKPNELADSFFTKWGAIDGPSALAAAESLESFERDNAVKNVFKAWARVDLAAAWDVAQSYLDDTRAGQAKLARGVLKEVAKREPERLMRLIASDTKHHLNGSLRAETIDAAFESGQQGQLLAKLHIFEDAEERARWTTNIFRQWGQQDSDAATEALALITDPTEAEAAMTGFLSGWSRSDPAGALEYALDHHGDPAVERVLQGIVSQSIRSGKPEANAALVDRISDAGLLDKLAPTVTLALATSDPTAAFRIATSLSNADQRSQAQASVMRTWARDDFESARAHFAQQSSDETKANLLPAIATAIFRNNNGGTQLTTLLDAIPPGPERSKAIENLLEQVSPFVAHASADFRSSLKQAADSDRNLSEKGRALRSKVFGDE